MTKDEIAYTSIQMAGKATDYGNTSAYMSALARIFEAHCVMYGFAPVNSNGSIEELNRELKTPFSGAS